LGGIEEYREKGGLVQVGELPPKGSSTEEQKGVRAKRGAVI